MLTSRIFHRRLLLWFHIVCMYHSFVFVSGNTRDYFDAKHALVKKLTNMSAISKEILPARDIDTPVDVKIRIKLRQIAKVDEKDQAVRITVWLQCVWNNPFLHWDPKDYHGIESVHVNNELFWVPDIALFNEASLEEEIQILYKRLVTKLVITYDGNCTWNAPVALLSQCKIDVSRFPFDEQTCNITIGSWTYSGNKINVTYHEKNADLSNFIPNGEWIVRSALLHNNVGYYGAERIPFPDVTLSLKIKRRSLYYGLNLIIPSALISLLALLAFILPPDNGERISLIITVLLANSVYMLIASASLPETSDAIPVFGLFCLGIIVTIALCLFATCLTLKVCELTCPVPDWVEVLILQRIARIVCVKPLRDAQSRLSLADGDKFTKIPDENPTEQDSKTEDIPLENTKEKHPNNFEASLLKEIRWLTEELRSKQEEEVSAKKWKKVAQVLNRFFCLIFSVVYVCLIIYLLASM